LLAHCARRFVTIPRPPAPALFPYTTLFRSGRAAGFTILESNNVPFVSGDNPNYKVIAGSPIAWSYAEQISKVEAYRPERRFADAVKGLHLYGAKVVRPTALAVLSAARPS